ncbi:MAG TPA: hypothetical protein VM009_05975 [Terriglobales bacterium]|nr:hypothetical protein [Terriglobales bacterium]
MATATLDLNAIAGQWRAARRIYPIYSMLVRHFDLGIESCRDLESPINRSEPEVMQRIAAWFIQADAKIEAFQLRQVLQTTELCTEENLRALVKRQLAYPKKTKAIRDKVDFLMVQYYAHCSPHGAHEDLSFDHFGEVLEPLLGDVSPLLPAFCSELDTLLTKIDACTSLGELLNGQIIERAREIKEQAEEKYFSPSVLVAVARFNYMLRLAFFRLMHADLHAIRFALHGMEARGQRDCDCSAAGLSTTEPLTSLRQLCHEWKMPFRAAYSAGANFKQLVAVRAAVEKALATPLPVKKEIPVAEAANALLEAAAKAVLASEVTPAPKAQVAVATAKPAAPAKPVAQPIAQPLAKPVPKPVAAKPAKPAPAAAVDLDLDGCLEQIASQLINTTPQVAPVTNVSIGTTKLLLASWEVAAFVRGGDDVSDALQRAVSARAFLSVQIDAVASGATGNLAGAIQSAHTEAAQLQELIAEAKDAKNIDAAVNLAASAKRLLSRIEEAEKLK